METKTITITVEGGVIQSVDDIPEGVEVRVMDFDTEGCDEMDDPDNLKRDDNGDLYFESIWTASECPFCLGDEGDIACAYCGHAKG